MDPHNVTLFNFENQTIRVLFVQDNPWFVAKDVLLALGETHTALSNVAGKLVHIPEQYKARHPISMNHRVQEVWCLDKDGIEFLLEFHESPKVPALRKQITEAFPEAQDEAKSRSALSLLIPVEESEIGGKAIPAVDARKLHAFLEVKTQFSIWITRRIKEYGFTQGVDFEAIIKNDYNREKPPTKEYLLSVPMAKELSMVERNQKGRQARRYFISVEHKYYQALSQLIDYKNNKDRQEAKELPKRELSTLEELDRAYTKAWEQAGKAGARGRARRIAANNLLIHYHDMDYLKLTGLEFFYQAIPQKLYTDAELAYHFKVDVREINLALVRLGFQKRYEGPNNKRSWTLLDKGRNKGSYFPTGEIDSRGDPAFKILWFESVILFLEDELTRPSTGEGKS